MEVYTGKPVSKGYATGKVLIFSRDRAETIHETVKESEKEEQLKKYREAKAEVAAGLEAVCQRAREQNDDKAQIMEAHLAILSDGVIDDEICDQIQREARNAMWAVEEVYGVYIKSMERAKNEVFRERAADFRDIRDRITDRIAGITRRRLDQLSEPCIVVCHELMPSDTVGIDRNMVKGIVAEVGGETSHSAILARGYKIPAVLGIKNVTGAVSDGEEIVVDAVEGRIYVRAEAELFASYEAKAAEYEARAAEIEQYLSAEPVTADGTRIQVMANVGSIEGIENPEYQSADGVGLFRTEFLYMENDHFPTEEEQVEAYKKILHAFEGKPVVLRTLDIGGDKKLSYFPLPKEDNPFLGERALRLCFSHPELFHTQLRAALRASVYGNLWLMFPMVGSMEDIRKAKAALHAAQEELRAEGIAYSSDIKVGVMIEIPSLALIADKVAREVDFASIGSNDLIQYTMAADRMNEAVSDYYQNLNPAVLRLIRYTVDCFLAAGKSVSVCGELGGNPLSAFLFLGMGMRKLSMSVSQIAPVKKMICSTDLDKARQAAGEALGMETEEAVTAYVQKQIKE